MQLPVIVGQTYSLLTEDYPLKVEVCSRLANTSTLICRDLTTDQQLVLKEELFRHFEPDQLEPDGKGTDRDDSDASQNRRPR